LLDLSPRGGDKERRSFCGSENVSTDDCNICSEVSCRPGTASGSKALGNARCEGDRDGEGVRPDRLAEGDEVFRKGVPDRFRAFMLLGGENTVGEECRIAGESGGGMGGVIGSGEEGKKEEPAAWDSAE
jgi:hypothetical protein